MFGNSFLNRRFDDLFRQVEREMADVERRIDRLRQQTAEGGASNREGPFVYGWTVQVGPDGEPRVQRWGNVEDVADPADAGEADDGGWREPFVTATLDEDEEAVRFTAEMPGVEKEDIHVETTEESVLIEAEGAERRYRTEVPVDRRLDPETAEANYNNGILEVHVGLHDAETSEGTRVPVK